MRHNDSQLKQNWKQVMSQFIRSEAEHPLLSRLTAAYLLAEKEEKFLSDAIRRRNQSRSELVKEPDRSASQADREKYRERGEQYRTAVLQERCAINILHRELLDLSLALKSVVDKLADNKDQNEYGGSGLARAAEKEALKDYAIEVAQRNVRASVELCQQAMTTILRARVITLDHAGDAHGDCWYATSYLESIPPMAYRDESIPETLEAFDMHALLCTKVAENRLGKFTALVEQWSPKVVARIAQSFIDIGWEITLSQVGDDGSPMLVFGELKRKTRLPAQAAR